MFYYFFVVKINLIVSYHISISDIFKISQQNFKLMIMYILVFFQRIGRMLNNLSSIFDTFFPPTVQNQLIRSK